MKKLKGRVVVGCFCICFWFFNGYAAAKSQEFNKASFEEIKDINQGRQWLMILWSVDCPACFKELTLLKKISKIQPDIAVVIINADDNEDVNKERDNVITSYQLSSLPNYHFANAQGDASRYLIDPFWYGELPRSYFVNANGGFHGKSGLIDEQAIKTWLSVK